MNAQQYALTARIALSLWTSARTVERLPTVRVFEPSQIATLTYTANAVTRAGDYL
jgi:hypothetical protein